MASGGELEKTEAINSLRFPKFAAKWVKFTGNKNKNVLLNKNDVVKNSCFKIHVLKRELF